MIPVSTATELALRAAMSRLLDGKSERTDGGLTVVNLATEAGVSRATANRATGVLKTFREAVAEISRRRGVERTAQQADSEETSRYVKDLLAQHLQVRALLRASEQRRITRQGVRLRIID
ncbi:hypothetical protein [Mesorhizobium sp.]|uniref:hypothetical protein n=1 Tax=Mesorhizobium sp. TaxID=1871066 RepID=UPI000FE6FD4B|nr:hypothetical protein [Mesorhizobium sp.]RWD43461.1 MAG: hypothetical protein EOS35_20865 [Mesorhizobium sp.]